MFNSLNKSISFSSEGLGALGITMFPLGS